MASSSGTGSRSDLYRWKRWTRDKPPATAPVKKKVEMASDQAAAITFGLEKPRHHDYTMAGHSSAMATLDVLQDHNEAYTEAQDLLSQWMAEKINIEGGDDNDNFDDDYLTSPMQPHKSDLQNQWESMLEENAPGMVDPYNKVTSEELFHEIETRDDDRTVENILKGMLDKEVVQKSFKQDLGLRADKKKKKDPRVTMEARQRKVKENREKRQLEKEQELRQKQAHKDAQLQARQMIMKEERQKTLQRQREEALIQQEMAKIRKEMQSQRQAMEETKNRQKQLEEIERERMHLEEEKRREEEAQTRLQAERLLEEERHELLHRAQELKDAKAAEDLKCLQRHFQAWYQLVVHRRLKIGKARAVSDWRCLVRAWNAWKAYVRACRAEKEAKEAEIFIKESHRKRHMAETHNRQRILRKYFSAWQNWIVRENQQKTLFDNQEKTRSKMAAFLEAAASGKLWTNRSEDESLANNGRKDKSAHRTESDVQKVEELFSQPVRRQDSASSVHSTARSDSSQETRAAHSQRSKGAPSKPKFAWQVTRKHVHMTAEEIASIGETMPNRNQNNAVPSMSPRPSSESLASERSKRTIQYTVNNFEHRYAAQQKILHDQQQQLREQQRLIEDLQTAQKHALLQMQLNNIKEGGAGLPIDINHMREGVEPMSGRSTGERPSERSTGERSLERSTSARSEPESSVVSTAHSDETQITADSSMSQQSGAKKKPPTLKGMEEREALRAKRKAEREERQRKKEEEKLAKIKEEDEKRIAAEEAEKKAKIERRREEKRLARQRELEKQQRLQQIAELNAKADEHYKHSIMRNYGFKPWRKLMQVSHQNMDVAIDHHSNMLLRKCVLPWHHYTQGIKRGKLQVAEDQYQYILVRRCFNSWKRFGHYQSILLQKARRHYALTLKVKTLTAWQDYVTNERLEGWRKEELATQHNTQRIVKKAFYGLRQYPKMLKAEREREKRREEMRKKVSSIIPDFGLS